MIERKINFVCANCLSVNRVPASRLTDNAVCGRCKQSLHPVHPIELTDESFQKFITRSDTVVVVDFWAKWCPPCRAMGPAFAQATIELSPEFVLTKLDTEEAPQTANQFNIQGIPCMIAFKQGKEIARQSGAMNTEQIVQWVKSI